MCVVKDRFYEVRDLPPRYVEIGEFVKKSLDSLLNISVSILISKTRIFSFFKQKRVFPFRNKIPRNLIVVVINYAFSPALMHELLA